MKKLFSIVISFMFVLSCSVSAFAQTASPDEPKEVKSIKFERLPDKLIYTDEDLILDADISEDETDFDKIIEALKTAVLTLDIDLSGAILNVEYADGTTDKLDNELCEVKVADPIKFSDFDFSNIETEEDYEKFMALIYRNYTVEVEYEGAKTSYTVLLKEQEYDPTSTIYEFVSYDDPLHKEYVLEEDVYEDVYYDDDDNEIPCEYLDIDVTGMTVTLRNKETGELETFGEDDIFIDFFNLIPEGAPKLKEGNYSTIGEVWTEDGVVPFTYNFTIVSKKTDNANDNKKPADKDNTSNSVSTSDSTKPSASGKLKSDNSAVQTGSPVPAAVLAVLMLSGTAVVFFAYRRKFDR